MAEYIGSLEPHFVSISLTSEDNDYCTPEIFSYRKKTRYRWEISIYCHRGPWNN